MCLYWYISYVRACIGIFMNKDYYYYYSYQYADNAAIETHNNTYSFQLYTQNAIEINATSL